jgi:hypothetical protein
MLAYWANKAGAIGPVKDLAKKNGCPVREVLSSF